MENWFQERTFHHEDFSDIGRLVDSKERQGYSISLGLPTLNVAKTVGEIVEVMRSKLMEEFPLLDQIAIIDSRSSDATTQIAKDHGADVFYDDALITTVGPGQGKGEALWKSLAALDGDIILWIDSDIKNIHPRFVYGLVGPLLSDADIGFIKGFYRRPRNLETIVKEDEGGRATELMARPLLNYFFPELGAFVQPLSGEYGGRREVLESVPFFTGYAVEIRLLIDIWRKYGLSRMAQVDLDKRVHRHHSLTYLSRMAFAILQGACSALIEDGRMKEAAKLNTIYTNPQYRGERIELIKDEVRVRKRPPMATVSEYLDLPAAASLFDEG